MVLTTEVQRIETELARSKITAEALVRKFQSASRADVKLACALYGYFGAGKEDVYLQYSACGYGADSFRAGIPARGIGGKGRFHRRADRQLPGDGHFRRRTGGDCVAITIKGKTFRIPGQGFFLVIWTRKH